MIKLRLLFVCVVLFIAGSVSAIKVKRSHHDPWAPRHCWDHGTNFVIDPFCPILKDCSKPPIIAHGKFSDPDLTLQGIQVIYTCNSGYNLFGEAQVTCAQKLGMPKPEWGPVPTCKSLCSAPPTIANGSYIAPEVALPGSQANYTCDAGFQLAAGNSVTCGDTNGKWSTPTPECVEIPCPAVPSIDNGFPASGNDTAVGTQIEYQCIENYNFQTDLPTTVECLFGGKWSSPLPVCLPPDCAPIATIDNGSPVGTNLSTILGSTVGYVCDAGHKLTDINETTCLITGYWSVLPECVPTSCGPFPEIQYANITESTNTTVVGAIAQYECLDGYQLVGNQTVECLPTLVWSASPYCEPVCPDLPEVPFGQAVLSELGSNSSYVDYEYENSTVVKYKCDVHYSFVGLDYVECVNGQWTNAPVCEHACYDIDIVILADGSGSIGTFGFEDTMNFVKDMLSKYPSKTTQFALALFSTDVYPVFNLKDYINDYAGIRAKLANTSYPTGNTNTYLALEYARTDMFQKKNGMRKDALNVAIVITDGQSSDLNLTASQAKLLKDQSVTVYAVGVGTGTDAAELKAIASRDSYVFNINNYANITAVSGPLSEKTCTVRVPATTTPEISE